MKWQPIETCPPYGFFLVYEDEAIRTMMRVDGKWEHIGIPIMITDVGNRLVSSDVKRIFGHELIISDCIHEPTHWMEVDGPEEA
jgi:hypothetical protein